jgi:hypothetical protein
MAKCANCGATMTCGCQKRKLADGKYGCTKCASTPPAEKKNNTAPIVKSVKINP